MASPNFLGVETKFERGGKAASLFVMAPPKVDEVKSYRSLQK